MSNLTNSDVKTTIANNYNKFENNKLFTKIIMVKKIFHNVDRLI